MKLLLPARLVGRLVLALRAGGKREVGGVLMGEHVDADTFRVVDLTVQTTGGTFATFVRFVEGIVKPLREFFASTDHNYTRFNYLGEWHSHHSFSLEPSARDHSTMFELVEDVEVGARFATLLLVRLSAGGDIQAALFVYRPGGLLSGGSVVREP